MKYAAALVMAAVLGSCSFARSITGNSLDYNNAIEEHDNSQLVINILRARDNVPVSFSDLSQIRGSIQATGSLQSNWPFGPLRASTTRGAEQPTLSFQMSPTFDISPLNTTLFTTAIMQPVDKLTVATLQETNFIKDSIIYNLFIDTIKEIDPDGTTTIYRNMPCPELLPPPKLPTSTSVDLKYLCSYDSYNSFILKLKELLTVPGTDVTSDVARRIVFHKYKELTLIGPLAGTLAPKDIPNNPTSTAVIKVENGKVQVYYGKDKVAICLVTIKSVSRGLSKGLTVETDSMGLDNDRQSCEQDEVKKADYSIQQMRKIKYVFEMRSIRGIFDYLGHLLYIRLNTPQPNFTRPFSFDIAKVPYDKNWISGRYRDVPFYVAAPDSVADYAWDTPKVLQILTELLNESRNASEIATTKATQSVGP